MIENTVFLLGFSVLLLIVSPILAIMERLFLGFGAILMILILGIIILSSPLVFITGIVLIITNSSGTGIHLIIFSILAPLVVTPLLSEFNDPDFYEIPNLLIVANSLIVLATYYLLGSTDPMFIPVMITSIALVIGDFMNNQSVEIY